MSATTDIALNLNHRTKRFFCTTLSTTAQIRHDLPQILAVTIKNVMLAGFGMTLGFPTILIGGLEDSQHDFKLNQEQLSWIGAINLIFVPVGCLASGHYCEYFGRKRGMQIANIPLAAVWLLFRYSSAVWHLYLGLATIGILLGLLEAPVITYISEVTTPNLRGTLYSLSTLFTILGTLGAFFLGSIYYWRSVAQIAFLVPVISINLLFLIPESPHWLIKQERHEEAQLSLAWLRGWVSKDTIHQEYSTLNAYIHQGSDSGIVEKFTCYKYNSPSFLKPYAIITLVFFIRHFSGITNIQTYAVDIFGQIHSPINKYNATVAMGVCELLGCITCAALIKKLGKRKLTFGAMTLSIACVLTILIYGLGDLDKGLNWIPMVGLLGYSYFAHCSLRTLPWVLIGEFYPPRIRAVASGVSAATGYLFGFVANKIFYTMENLLSLNGMFIGYAVVLLVGMILLYYCMPETEGKTLDEICNYFSNDHNFVCIAERNNNKDLNKLYKSPYKKSQSSGGVEVEGSGLQGVSNARLLEEEHNEGNENKMVVVSEVPVVMVPVATTSSFAFTSVARRKSSCDDYMISIDRLDANLSGPSYKRFDDVFTEF